MSRWGECSGERSGSSRWKEGSEVEGEGTGLPLISCPICGQARVIELRSKKENANFGKYFFKCPRNIIGMPGRCPYYRWQRAYFADLVDMKKIVVMGDECEEIHEEEVEEAGEAAEVESKRKEQNVWVQNKHLELKVEKMMYLVQLVIAMLVVFVILVALMYMFK